MDKVIDLIANILGQFSGLIYPSGNNLQKVETNKTKLVIIFIFVVILLLSTCVGEFFTIKRLIENSTNRSVVVACFTISVILLLIVYCCLQSIYNNIVIYRLKKQINKK